MQHIGQCLLSGALLLSLASCINDNYDEDMQYTDGKVTVELNIQTRSLSNSISSSSDIEYVAGTEWENYVDFANGDYRIYFFTYNPDDTSDETTNNNLIAEFEPLTIYSTDLNTYTTYTLSGELDEKTVESLTNFKVVVVANWGKDKDTGEFIYPSVTAGTTTIDDICNAQTAVFNAFVDNDQKATMPSASNLIPFFGLREYSGVTWKEGTMTRLSGDITLLRSVAKVEVILEPTEEQPGISFSNVSIVNYNATGYCAPTNVYLRSDYDHNYTWDEDFVDGLHLVNNANDSGSKTMEMQKTAATTSTHETWTCYLTEYDNTTTGTDYSYITVTVENAQYRIYFGNYDDDGQCTAYDEDGGEDDRYDIYRNYLYRFRVTYAGEYFRVHVDKWDDRYTNVFGFDSDYEASGSGGGD